MALSKDWPDPTDKGTIIVDAYAKFSSLRVDADNRVILVRFNVFRNAAARQAQSVPVDRVDYQLDDLTTPSFAQLAGDGTANASSIGGLCYNYAKSKPEFAGAIDA